MNNPAIEDAREHGIPLLMIDKRRKPAGPSNPRRPRKPKAAEKPTFVLDDAFNYFTDPPDGTESSASQFDNQRCALAVAFILDFFGYSGFEIDCQLAQALSQVLRKCASETERAEKLKKMLAERQRSRA